MEDDDDDSVYIIKKRRKNIRVKECYDDRRKLLIRNDHSQLLIALSSVVDTTSSNTTRISINDCSYISLLLSELITVLNINITNIINDSNVKNIYSNTYKCHDLFRKLYKYMSTTTTTTTTTTTIGLLQIVSYLSYHIREGIPKMKQRILKHQMLTVSLNCNNIFDIYVDTNTFISNTSISSQRLKKVMINKGYNGDTLSSPLLINIIIMKLSMPILKDSNDDSIIVRDIISVSINSTLLSLLSYISSKKLQISVEGIGSLYLNVVELLDFVMIAKQSLCVNGPLLDPKPWHKADAIILFLQTYNDYNVGSIEVYEDNYQHLSSHDIKIWTSLIAVSLCSILVCKSQRSSSKIHAILILDKSNL